MKMISVDQSLSCTAVTCWENETPTKLLLIKTGSSGSKSKTDGVIYFDLVIEQIDYIIKQLNKFVIENKIETIVMESPSPGSFGNALSKLLVLYGDLKTHFENNGIKFVPFSPTSIKAFARELLPESERLTADGKKVKMDKKLMVEAAKSVAPVDWFNGLTKSGKNKGLEDAADSFLAGLKFIKEREWHSSDE